MYGVHGLHIVLAGDIARSLGDQSINVPDGQVIILEKFPYYCHNDGSKTLAVRRIL
jgi:hypothetical protein